MARVLAHYIHAALAADHLARSAARFYRCLNFHTSGFVLVRNDVLQTACDTGFAPVWVELEQHFVPDEHFNAVEPHLAR
jgi:hypothetical protein